MASEKRRKKSPLADCTNTPNVSRPRRSCCSYASPSTAKQNSTIQSPQPNNPLIDPKHPLTRSNNNQNQNEGHLRVKSSCPTSTTVLPGARSYQTPQRADDSSQNNGVYIKHREREGTSLQVTSSCPTLGRGSLKSKQKTGRSHEGNNCSKNLDDSSTPGINNHGQNEVSSNGNYICEENLSTPQPCVAAIDSFQFPDDIVDANLENIKVQSMLQGSSYRSFEKVSLSFPPLGRSVRKSHTGERCTELWKYSSLGARDDSPASGIPKLKAQRRGKSLPVNKRKHTLPEKFIKEQRAHFAEIDAFALEEEEHSSDAD